MNINICSPICICGYKIRDNFPVSEPTVIRSGDITLCQGWRARLGFEHSNRVAASSFWRYEYEPPTSSCFMSACTEKIIIVIIYFLIFLRLLYVTDTEY